MTTESAPDDREPSTMAASPGDQGEPSQTGRRLALKNWRVRTRLVALVLIPTLVGIALGAQSVVSSLQRADHYRQLNEAATLVGRLSALAHELARERDMSARFIAAGRNGDMLSQLRRQQQVVDDAATQATTNLELSRGTLDQISDEEFQRVGNRIREISSLRNAVVKTQLEPHPAVETYSRAITDLLSLHDNVTQGESDTALIRNAAALGALARAKDEASKERATLAVALQIGRFDTTGLNAMTAARAQRDTELEAFRSEAPLDLRQRYDDTVTGRKIDSAEFTRARALVLGAEGAPLRRISAGRGTEASRWFDQATDRVEKMREVEKDISDAVVTRSAELRDAERRSGLIVAGAVAALLAVVLLITVLMARSLVKPLRRLRSEALDIAGRKLPETVQSLRERGEAAAAEVTPIGVASADEIGEVARAFDEVHREAVRLAGQEATLRSNVNAMFVNLSRRSQTLVERQLALIESLEQGEQDEGRLGSLFRLDHLATRMRRNSENLLVLAGQEPARRWSQPVPLIDVVRASLSEVENYERVDLRVSGGVSVAGTAVNDVVHLIAELVENAISFSPRETKVVVSSNRIDGGGLMVSVTDIGIGMTPEELAEANWRLANPPVVDVSVSRRMGLFVVGRLALRHGIRVQLRQQDSGGLTAMILLPDSLVSLSGAPAKPAAPVDWAASSASLERPAVMASPTAFDSAAPPSSFSSFSSFDAAQRRQHSFGSFDASWQFGSAEAPRSAPGGDPGRAPLDTPWPGHVPPPGSASEWSTTSRADAPVWPEASARGGAPAWPDAPARGDSVWPDTSAHGGDSIWSDTSVRGGDSGAWSVPPARPGDSGGWPPADTSGPLGRRGQEEAENTGPLPAVQEHSPMEEAKEEFLPIFAAVESDWFKKAEPVAQAPASAHEPARESAREPETAAAADAWSSPADAGWQAARAVAEPTLGGLTGSGLPKRVPKANLVPGAVSPDLGGSAPAPPLRPAVSPEAVRNRLASFQKGVRQGRAAARGEAGEDRPYPDFGRDVEANKEDR
ncbi:nitrate- and nitrite sensing domain-containing protein [Streptosporangium sandarakinum]|uniref:nitrate- and nitrite sensing domain-containing protein n=1 Tax=Streptosporangium sandarakinum TaxID=1260955 RepID=UPI003439F9F0